MNILITIVPNPNIRYFETSINLIQIFEELKGIIEFKIKNHKVRVQKQHKFS
tara:strand:+ start:120524 stop:120679 length:156 start_codon:yes stop_codon:yes gene_type:complete